jgi:predicted lysophospholipase L1 biosynthesis ABC-type transport system permease subunit
MSESLKKSSSLLGKVLGGGFGLLLLALLGLELLVHKHVAFSMEEWFGFYPACGLLAALLLVLVANYLLRPLVRRDEDYYDR